MEPNDRSLGRISGMVFIAGLILATHGDRSARLLGNRGHHFGPESGGPVVLVDDNQAPGPFGRRQHGALVRALRISSVAATFEAAVTRFPTLDDDIVQVLPDAPIDELLAAHVRGCRLMEAAGHARLRVPDEASARTLVLHEIDHIRRRLKRMSHRDRMQLLRAQRGAAAAGHILSAHESLPPPPSAPTARITA